MRAAARPIFLLTALLLHVALLAAGILFYFQRPPAAPAPPPVQVALIPPAVEAPASRTDTPAPDHITPETPAPPPPSPPKRVRPPKPAKQASTEPAAAKPPRTPKETPASPGPDSTRASVAPAEPPAALPSAPAAPAATAEPSVAAAPALPAAPPARSGVSLPADYAASNRKPEYPLASRRLGEQGTVVLRVRVQADGSAGEVELKSSSGHARLDQSAMNAVRAWRFRPATIDGKPVAEWYQISIPFTLQN